MSILEVAQPHEHCKAQVESMWALKSHSEPYSIGGRR